jgi:hypothetical protein
VVTPLKFLLFPVIVFVLAAAGEYARARETQFHLRTGVLTGKYSGLFSGKFDLYTTLDLDFELFMNNKSSFLFRFIQGFDSPDSRPFYTNAGIGMRYYFFGRGASEMRSTAGLGISSEPTLRAYVGGDAGISQVLVKSFGPTVQAVANMVDFGGNVGAIYQLSSKFGVEAHVGASYGYGMSSTNATGSTMRFMGGITYFF